jgi:hypothetical protein
MLHVLHADLGATCTLAFIEDLVSLFKLGSSVRLVATEQHILNQQQTLQTTLGWLAGSSDFVKRGVWPGFFKAFNKEHFPIPHTRDKWREISLLATAVKMNKPYENNP